MDCVSLIAVRKAAHAALRSFTCCLRHFPALAWVVPVNTVRPDHCGMVPARSRNGFHWWLKRPPNARRNPTRFASISPTIEPHHPTSAPMLGTLITDYVTRTEDAKWVHLRDSSKVIVARGHGQLARISFVVGWRRLGYSRQVDVEGLRFQPSKVGSAPGG